MIYSHGFRMMAQEGHLASTALLSAFEGMKKLNYDKPGTVYSALFQLATGFERIMKIAVILDHKTQHNLTNPTNAQMRSLGHSITDLYAYCRSAGERRGINTGWFNPETLQYNVVAFLSEFAKGSRYYNIDQLVSSGTSPDPLTRWFAIHWDIADRHVSTRRKDAIMERARSHCERLGMFGWEMGPFGRYDLTIDVTFQLEVARVSQGYCVWTLIELLKPIYRLIDRTSDEVQRLEHKTQVEPTSPYMVEFFPFCLATKDVAIRRKAWTTLFHIAGRL